jgi:hypothetical protein
MACAPVSMARIGAGCMGLEMAGLGTGLVFAIAGTTRVEKGVAECIVGDCAVSG